MIHSSNRTGGLKKIMNYEKIMAWNIIFSDEKIVLIEQAHIHQNNRIWSFTCPGAAAIVPQIHKTETVIIWSAICATGLNFLIFVEKGIKIIQENYRRDIFENVLFPCTQTVDGYFNKTSSDHRAIRVQQWCRQFSWFDQLQSMATI